jgi:uncharacterized OB-fold protein
VTSSRPRPVPDELSAAYWRGAAEGRLVIARCSRCARFAHPPDIVCPHCGHTAPDYSFAPVSGRGTIRSWTVIRQSFLPGFDADLPFVLADVALDEQDDLRLIGRLLDGPDAPMYIGARVTIEFERPAPDLTVPAFTLERDV